MNQISDHVTAGATAERLCYDHVLAVVCGVSDYSVWRKTAGYESVDDLDGVPAAIERMTRWLVDSVGAEIVLPPNPKSSRKYDPANATAPQITQSIEHLRDRLANESFEGSKVGVVVYLAGHGRALGAVGHLLAARVEADDYISRDTIWLGRIRHEFAKTLTQAHHLLFILDCCYAGFAALPAGGLGRQRVLSYYLSRRAVQVVCACRHDLRTPYDTPGGVFTRVFLDTVENLDGEVLAVEDLLSRVKRDAAVECLHPYVVSTDPSDGQFLVGIQTRQRHSAAVHPSQDEMAREALLFFKRHADRGVTFTRLDASRRLDERGIPGEKAIDHLIKNDGLEQRFDDYLYLMPLPVGKSKE